MQAVLVDTDVVSFLFKRDTRATLYEPHLNGTLQLISFMTLAELELWAAWRNWGKERRRNLRGYLSRYTLVFPDRVLQLRYEDLVADQEGQSRRLFAHCGLDWTDAALDFHRNSAAVATPSAAQVRATRSESPAS